ncbi:MAG TPA: fasciclin domain-containing protein [Allosphingosinicella sp.]|jgi:uncharacterized surface protein with fasciclin (FAS1) repeats
MRHLMVLAASAALAACGGNGDGGNGQAPAADGAAASGNAAGGQAGKSAAKSSLLASLAASPDHATLTQAIKSAGLEKTFSGAQPYTLFAPTEAAFQALPGGTLDGLMKPEAKGQLTALLTGHIVPGTVTAEDLTRAVERGKGKAQLATVGGATLTVTREGDELAVADAKGGKARVTGADGAASNGVIHGIDKVLAGQ